MDDLMFDQIQDEAEAIPIIPPISHVANDPKVSRRRLLGAAAGGFVLAASGLLVPEGAEAERDDHGDRHRRRHHHHRDRDEKDRAEIKGILDVEVNFFSGQTKTHVIEGWQGDRSKGPGHTRWALRWHERPVAPIRQQAKFTGLEPRLVLVVKTPGLLTGPLFFKVENQSLGAPTITIAQGTWNNEGAVDWGQTYFLNRAMKEGQRIDVEEFYVDRGNDSKAHKIFTINARD
jgi:hypothetical protein